MSPRLFSRSSGGLDTAKPTYIQLTPSNITPPLLSRLCTECFKVMRSLWLRRLLNISHRTRETAIRRRQLLIYVKETTKPHRQERDRADWLLAWLTIEPGGATRRVWPRGLGQWVPLQLSGSFPLGVCISHLRRDACRLRRPSDRNAQRHFLPFFVLCRTRILLIVSTKNDTLFFSLSWRKCLKIH